MARPVKGEFRFRNGVAAARVTLEGRDRPSLTMPHVQTDQAAARRSLLLAELARRMRISKVGRERSLKALEFVAESTDGGLAANLSAVEDLIAGTLDIPGAPKVPTLQSIGEDWTAGRLHARYPDQVRLKRTAEGDRRVLERYVYPHIGPTPIDRVTLDACEGVMQALPTDLASATRRNVGQLVSRLLTMAVYPLRLRASSPIPRGFLPRVRQDKALACLYPDEDRRLMACQTVPLEYRVLWGFLAREGMRAGEARGLTWGDLDLERGAVRLDQNKTDDPRAWALDPGVAEALRRFRERYRKTAEPGACVFVGVNGAPLRADGLPERLHHHLKAIGLHEQRPELFTTTESRRQIRVHDLRGTFVTLALANGRTEAWISDRTGHRSSVMINRYKRIARTFAELDAGVLDPLHEAIPELRSPTEIPSEPTRGDDGRREDSDSSKEIESRTVTDGVTALQIPLGSPRLRN